MISTSKHRDASQRNVRKRRKLRKAAAQTNAERQCQHFAVSPLTAPVVYHLPPCFNMLTLRWILERGRRRGRNGKKEKLGGREKVKRKICLGQEIASKGRFGRLGVWRLQFGGDGVRRPQGWAFRGRHKQQHQAKRKFAV